MHCHHEHTVIMNTPSSRTHCHEHTIITNTPSSQTYHHHKYNVTMNTSSSRTHHPHEYTVTTNTPSSWIHCHHEHTIITNTPSSQTHRHHGHTILTNTLSRTHHPHEHTVIMNTSSSWTHRHHEHTILTNTLSSWTRLKSCKSGWLWCGHWSDKNFGITQVSIFFFNIRICPGSTNKNTFRVKIAPALQNVVDFSLFFMAAGKYFTSCTHCGLVLNLNSWHINTSMGVGITLSCSLVLTVVQFGRHSEPSL